LSLSKYPAQLDDSSSVPLAVDLVTPVEALIFNRLRAAVFNVQAELGTNPSREFGTVRARLDDLRDLIETMSALLDAELNKVKISSVDTTSGYLSTKLVAGAHINITKLNSGSNETLRVASDGGSNLTAMAPTNVDANIAVVGVIDEAARADHKHDILTAVAVSVGAINAEGVSVSLSRADHAHAVTDLDIVGQVQGSILYFDGGNWVQLPPGDDGYVFTTHGVGADPNWAIDNGGIPTIDDKALVPAATIGNSQPTGLTITNTPFTGGYIRVDVNSLSAIVGNNDITKDCYFSGDGGFTSKAIYAIVAGDELIWNGIVAGFDLDGGDIIDFHYDVVI
jgi:hypothetical protein